MLGGRRRKWGGQGCVNNTKEKRKFQSEETAYFRPSKARTI